MERGPDMPERGTARLFWGDGPEQVHETGWSPMVITECCEYFLEVLLPCQRSCARKDCLHNAGVDHSSIFFGQGYVAEDLVD